MLIELGTNTGGRPPMVGCQPVRRPGGGAYVGAGVLIWKNQEQPVDEGVPMMQSSRAITCNGATARGRSGRAAVAADGEGTCTHATVREVPKNAVRIGCRRVGGQRHSLHMYRDRADKVESCSPRNKQQGGCKVVA